MINQTIIPSVFKTIETVKTIKDEIESSKIEIT